MASESTQWYPKVLDGTCGCSKVGGWGGPEVKAAQGGGRVTYYCLACCHCLARVGKMVKTSFDKSFEKKRNVWSPTDCYKAHCRWRGGPTFRSSSWKELDTAERVGQTGSREIPVDQALAQWNRAWLTRKRFWLKRKRISEVEFLPTMHIGHSEYLHGLHFSASLRHPIPYCNLVLM